MSVTQGELLRQEQEAGVVPVPVQTPMVSMNASTGRVTRSSSANAAQISADADTVMPPEDTEVEEGTRVHARGPELIGMEDMGPQASSIGVGGLDIEAAVGRRGEAEGMLFGSSEVEMNSRAEEDNLEDHTVVVTDADGVADGETSAEATGQNIGGDAADSSILA